MAKLENNFDWMLNTIVLYEFDSHTQKWDELVNTKENQSQFAALAQGTALASLWLGKLVASVLAIHFSMKAGYSSLHIGLMLPVGIIIGIMLLRFFDRKKSS
jgi:hypothetical protein